MGIASVGYPFDVITHCSTEKSGSLCGNKFSRSNFPIHVKILRTKFSLSSGSVSSSKGLASKIYSLPEADDSFSEKASTPILDLIENPINLKNLSYKELEQLANEIRGELSYFSSKTRKSFKASLAVAELTVAIHHVFHAPADKILWDVDEQTYAHKILTGRRPIIETAQRDDGLSGFMARPESEYDPFGPGHGCNSISAGLGMAIARDLKGKRERVVAVISNATTMAGQAYEAMSNAGYLDTNMIVILNDTRHSLHPKNDDGSKTSITALSSTLSKLQSSKSFRRFREVAKGVTKRIGRGMHEWAAKVDEYARGLMGPPGSTLFEELGLYYIGPVNGNKVEDLICVLQEVASLDSMGPVLIHVITEENHEPESYPIQQEDASDPGPLASEVRARTYSDCFAEALVAEAEKDRDIVSVHAGMHVEPAIELFRDRFPEKLFEVGMAEQHAVTFSAGLARGGLKPFCVIPSAYLQRAYDQVVHDVDRQRVAVRFVIGRAGVAGPAGAVESGAFDVAFMACLPNMVVMAPSDHLELANMVATAARIDDRPVCFRYPSATLLATDCCSCAAVPIEIGKGKVLVEGNEVALLGYGSMVQNCLEAQSLLSKLGIQVTVADARFCKPLDASLLRTLCENHSFLITVEEGSIGGFGSHVAQFIALDGRLDGRTKWRPIVLPDNYIERSSPTKQLSLAGLTGHHIAATALSLLGRTREALLLMH